ncbi:MAG: alkaline phosphatase family protein [Fimbriimonadaceae bacterium]
MKIKFIPVLISFTLAAIAIPTILVLQKGTLDFTTGWHFAPAGKATKTGDLLAGGELSPNKKWVSFVAVGQGTHQLTVVDYASGKVASQITIPPSWFGQAWSADSNTLYVSGGPNNSITAFQVDDQGNATSKNAIKIPSEKDARLWIAGLVRKNNSLFAALSGIDKLAKIDLETQEIQLLDLPDKSSPYQLRIAPNGNLYVSLQATAQIAEIEPDTFKMTRTLPTGRHPNDILIAEDRLFVACGNEDTVEIFDLYTFTQEERINVRPWPDAPAGSTPNALAIDPSQEILYVALSDNNAVASIDIETRGHSVVQGYIPSALYPTAVATLSNGNLLIGSGKGTGTGPNGNTEKIDPIAPQGYPYIVTLMNGSIALVQKPNNDSLSQYTKAVLNLSKYKPNIAQKPIGAPAKGSNPIPSELGEPTPIKHVLYIIKENRTYDQVFGDLTKDGKKYGNGDPKLTLFGQDVAPNHRQLARDYVLMDNFYASGEVSVDGHHWSKGAYVPNYMQRTWPQQYSGKGAPRLLPSLAQPPNGFIWDRVRQSGKSYRTYYYHTTDRANPEWAAARRANVRDYQSVDIFIKEFKENEAKRTTPSFMVMALSEDHTSGTRAGAATPQAAVASNDYGLGKLVETISHSSLWDKFAIFVVEDDAQNGPDHVDAHRTICLAISPYTRNRGVDSTHYTTTSILRTISLILNTKPMSQFDAAATPFYNAFRLKPDSTPYNALKPNTDLDAKNPQRAADKILDSIDFSEPDQLDRLQEQALNRDIWKSVKGDIPYPGSTRRHGSPARQIDND